MASISPPVCDFGWKAPDIQFARCGRKTGQSERRHGSKRFAGDVYLQLRASWIVKCPVCKLE